MKKQFVSIIGLLLTLSIAMTGCGGSPETSESSSGTQIEEQSPSITQEDEPMKTHKKIRFQPRQSW